MNYRHTTSPMRLPATRSRRAFTLIELVTVIAILGILSTMILSVVIGVRRHSRKIAARAEVKGLESAWKQYYAEYKKWPSSVVSSDALAITGAVARLLEGDMAAGDNPSEIPFMEFSRFDADGDPVNPWGTSDTVATGCYYFMKLDLDYDNVVRVDGVGDVRRSVVIWTVGGHDGRIIGSWE